MRPPPSAYRSGMLMLGKSKVTKEGGDLMRFYTNQHPFYCGIDLHARSMYVCILSHDGEILLHRNMKAAPNPFLKAVAPYRGQTERPHRPLVGAPNTQSE